MSVSSRWPVVIALSVPAGERDHDGLLTVPGIERLFAEARTAYFERCTTVDAATIEVQRVTAERGRAAVDDEGVTVAVAVVEIFPDSFTMNARLRPRGPGEGDAIAASAWCQLSTGGEVTTAMRDEFIAHAHAARHFH